MVAASDTHTRARERSVLALVVLGAFVSYSYFYQGDGWSMTAHFVTLRSVVERGTFEITPFRDQTGDLSVVNGRVFSNKPPGLVLAGTIPYLLMATVERAAGLDLDSPRVRRANQYALTVLLCAVPGAALAGMIYVWFRTRRGMTRRASAALAAGFALGSLIWPYSGMLFNHVLVAALLFGAWMLLTSDGHSHDRALVAGLMLGVTVMTDYLIIPLLPLLAGYDVWRRRSFGHAAVLCCGPLLALLALMIYHAVNFGGPLVTSYAFDNPVPGMLLGKFHWPEWRRLYWLSYHRYRGLLVNCPLFVAPLLSLLTLRRRDLRPSAETIVGLMIIGYFVAFHLTYVSWAGGWGAGPRFFIPAMPFMFIFSGRAFERLPRVSTVLIVLSVINMLAITSVRALYPGSDRGAPTHEDPLGVCLLGLSRGHLAQGPGSFNLGMLLGLSGWWSLLPLLTLWVVMTVPGRRFLRGAAS